ncbi:hypothetical protein A6R68_02017 [Neotoma lepida]|uniref:Rad51-like C-terminal domain-containing protein n=1 Tax=Neotoma lepida TaxID=56216 RepID=A0A1A6GTZ4_NEOLE|nr:hypothetical protein A6R68_02017 [Neotoma lepida]
MKQRYIYLCSNSQPATEKNMADIKKLKSVGICTVKGIQMTTRRALCNVKGLSEAKVDKIKEAANKLIEPGFLTAFEYSEKRKMVFHITTGNRLRDIADRFNVDHDAVLDNVLYARAYTKQTLSKGMCWFPKCPSNEHNAWLSMTVYDK